MASMDMKESLGTRSRASQIHDTYENNIVKIQEQIEALEATSSSASNPLAILQESPNQVKSGISKDLPHQHLAEQEN